MSYACAPAWAQHPDLPLTPFLTPEICNVAPGTPADGDADRDGMLDGCERMLAMAFRPLLRYDARDDIGGESYYAVRRLERDEHDAGDVAYRILYMLSYYEDLGWEGGECRVFNVLERLRFWRASRRDWCAGHNGDSEFIVFDVAYDAAAPRWFLARAFLSAHWLGRTDDSRTVRDPQHELVFPDTLRPFPEVWVAYRKHASYATRAACEEGHRGQETCAGNVQSVRLRLEQDRNVGSRSFPAPNNAPGGLPAHTCVRSQDRHADAARHECFWDPADTFDGWQPADPHFTVTPYERALRTFGF